MAKILSNINKDKIVSFIKKNFWDIILILTSIVIIALTLGFSLNEFIQRLGYEFQQPYTADHSLYFTVGKGMASGLTPYTDLYENKPPMIFLMSYLSYVMTGDFYLINILSAISMIGVLVLPLIFLFLQVRKRKCRFSVAMLLFSLVLGISLLLSCYGEKRSGEGQVELQGAFFTLLSLFFAGLIKKDNKHFYHPFIILSGFFLAIGFMYKEPFGVMGVFCLLLMVRDYRDFLHRFLYIGIYTVITCIIILLVSRCFVSYFTVYLHTMLFAHISLYGSPLERMYNVAILVSDMYNFSRCLPIMVGIFLFADGLLSLLPLLKKEKTFKTYFFSLKDLFLLIFSMFVSALMVGLGGQYFNHHFVFALPAYVFYIYYFIEKLPIEEINEGFALLEEKKEEAPSKEEKTESEPVKVRKPFLEKRKNMTGTILLTFISIIQGVLCAYSFKHNSEVFSYPATIAWTTKMKEDASYVDAVLDALGEERYQYIGFNGFRPITYTKHNPLGPCFVQDPDNFNDETNYFVTSFRKQLKEANVIVYNHDYLGVISSESQTYLSENFTETLPDKVKTIPLGERFVTKKRSVTTDTYCLLYRKNKF